MKSRSTPLPRKTLFAPILPFLLLCTTAMAQEGVTVMPIIQPPYSPYLATYRDQLVVTVTNTSQANRSLMLTGVIEGDNGYGLRTNSSYQPPLPVTLGPFETRTLPAGSPSLDFLDPGNITVNAPQSVQNAVAQTGQLPEGSYSLCIRALDYNTRTPLSAEAPAGCLFFPITSMQPPMVTWPLCGDSIATPWPAFTWTPPIGLMAGADIRYDLYVLQLLPGQNAVQAMGQAIDYHANNPMVRSGLMAPGYTWLGSDPPLQPGAWYALCVVAKDQHNQVLIQNQGRSEVCLFRLRQQQQGGSTATTTTTMQYTATADSMLPIPNARLRGRLLYAFKEPDVINMSGQHYTASGQVNASITSPDGAGSTAGSSPMTIGPFFADPSAMTSGYQGGGSNAAGTSWINANPSTSFGGLVFNGGLFTAFPTQKWMDPHPVAAPAAKPLANMQVRLVERIVLDNVEVIGKNGQVVARQDQVVVGLDEPTAMRSGILMKDAPGIDDYTGQLGNAANTIPRGRTLKVFNTGTDGTFTVDYHQLSPTGNQLISPVLHGYNPGMAIQGGYVQTSWTHTYDVHATRAYPVLMLEVVSPYYCSPDLRILAQPGDDLQLPDATVYVRSYGLVVHVMPDDKKNQTIQDRPIPNIRVKLMRNKDQKPFGIPADEGQDPDKAAEPTLVAKGITNANGDAVFQRLVRHDRGAVDPYTVNLASNDSAGSIAYAKQTIAYAKYPGVPGQGYNWNDDAGTTPDHPQLNSKFNVAQYTLNVSMHPRWPRIIGRVMASSIEAVPGAKVTLGLDYAQNPKNPGDTAKYQQTVLTDAHGYFQFDVIPVNVSAQDGTFQGPYATLHVGKAGFKTARRPEKGKQKMQYGFQWDLTAGIFLQPLGTVTGTVVDEDGRPVKSDVKGGDAPTVRTETRFVNTPGGGSGANHPGPVLGAPSTITSQEQFTAPCPSGNLVAIRVEPLSDKYFGRKFYKAVSDAATQDIGPLVVMEKLHRLRVTVRGTGNAPVGNAVVRVDGRMRMTDAAGQAEFRFASKDNEFRLKVAPGGSYVPVDTLIINEVSPGFTELAIRLKPGKPLHGRVVEQGTTAGVPGARVWVELGHDAYGPIRLEGTTAQDGIFSLNGVPLDATTVHAAKAGEGIGWIGDTQPLELLSLQGIGLLFKDVTLTLKRSTDMDLGTLLGFAVEVENYQANSNGTATISGAFVNLPANSNFAPEDSKLRLPFSNVQVKKGVPNSQGLPRAEPVSGSVTTDAMQVALKMYGTHDMTLEGTAGFMGMPQLLVVPDGNAGAIRGKVGTELSTFKFTYDFHGNFYLGEGPDNYAVTVFTSGAPPARRNYNLMDLGYPQKAGWALPIPAPKDIAFRLRGFDAYAPRAQSYATTDTFNLKTMLRIHDIPDMSPNELSIDVGNVKVMNEDIIGIQGGGGKLSLSIGQWKLEGTTPWSFDKDLGCIRVAKGKLLMGKANADVDNMIVWPTGIDLDARNLSQVRLGGVAPLKEQGNAPWEFGYSQAEKAWVLGKMAAQPVMYFDGIPKLVPDRVDLTVFRLLSNGQDKVGVKESDHVFEQILDFRVTGIDVGTDNVQLLGVPYLQVPNFPASQEARMLLARPGSQLKGSMMPFNATIPTTGNVKYDFLGQEQVISPGKFTTTGRLLVYDEDMAGHFQLIGRMTHTKSQTVVDVIKVDGERSGNKEQEVQLDGGQTMLVRQGKEEVAAGQWKELWFDANLKNSKAIALDQPPMHFVAKGAVRVDGGSVKMDQVSTPFGGMQVSYDFKKSQLVGSLTLNNFPSAPLTVRSATLGMIAGGGGFAVYCGDADVTIDILPPLINHLQPGFIIGAHTALPNDLIQGVMAKARNKSLPPQLKSNRVNGIFVTAKKPLLEVDLPGIDLGVVSAGGYLNTGIDTRFWLDLEQGLHVGGLAYFEFKYGADVTLCSMCLALLMELELQGDVKPDRTFSADACGVASISGSICGVGVSESVKVAARLSSSDGLSVGLGSGSGCTNQNVPSCQ